MKKKYKKIKKQNKKKKCTMSIYEIENKNIGNYMMLHANIY